MKNNFSFQSQIELNADKTDRILSGYAVIFNETGEQLQTTDEDGNTINYKEVITQDSLKDTDMSNTFLDFNHNPDYLLARISNNSLNLDIDDKGLNFSAKLNHTQLANDIYEQIRTGNISQMSFWATFNDSNMYSKQLGTDEDGNILLEVAPIAQLIDVSVVVVPAFSDTNVQIARDFLNNLNTDKNTYLNNKINILKLQNEVK